MSQYNLEKKIWTEADFDTMQWHDVPLLAYAYNDNYEIIFDIDYIFQWVLKGKKYSFWIAPATLVFENVYNVSIDIISSIPSLNIDYITKENPRCPKNAEYINKNVEFDWSIELQEGTISFTSVGFKLYIRKEPRLLQIQKMNTSDRGETSFERKSF